MALPIIEAVIALLVVLGKTEVGKELDQQAAKDIKSLHDRAHALRSHIHGHTHKLFHRKDAP